MTYNSFLRLVSTLSTYLSTNATRIKLHNMRYLIQSNLAKNIDDATYLAVLMKEYKNGNCSLQHVALSVICLHYENQDICLENAMGTKAHMSYIIRQYTYMFPGKRIYHVRDKVRAIEKFIYDGTE